MGLLNDIIARNNEKDELRSSIPLMAQALSQYEQPEQAGTDAGDAGGGDGNEDDAEGPDFSSASKATKGYRDILEYEGGLDKDHLNTMGLGQLRGLKDALTYRAGLRQQQMQLQEMQAHLADYNAQAEVRKAQAMDQAQGTKMIQRYGELLTQQGQDPDADAGGETAGGPGKVDPQTALAQTLKESGTVGRYSDNALGMLLKYHNVMSGADTDVAPKTSVVELGDGSKVTVLHNPKTGNYTPLYGNGLTPITDDTTGELLGFNTPKGPKLIRPAAKPDESMVSERTQKALTDWHKRLDPVQQNIEQVSGSLQDPGLKIEDKVRKQKILKTLTDQRDEILSERPKFGSASKDASSDEETGGDDGGGASKAVAFKNPVEVRAAVTTGKLTKAQATKILREKFGFN